MASIPRSSARVLRSAKPVEPGAMAVPQLLPKDTKRNVGIDPHAPRCSMRFETADGEWVQCCGQERLFRLPGHIRGQPLRSKVWPFDEGKGGDLTSIKAAPQKLLMWRKQVLQACH